MYFQSIGFRTLNPGHKHTLMHTTGMQSQTNTSSTFRIKTKGVSSFLSSVTECVTPKCSNRYENCHKIYNTITKSDNNIVKDN